MSSRTEHQDFREPIRPYGAASRVLVVLAAFICLASLDHERIRVQGQPTPSPAETLLKASEWEPSNLAEWQKRWAFYTPEKDSPREKTWTLQKGADNDGPTLICLGKPYGYLRTRAAHEDFEFQFQWRYPKDVNGNSGILVHTNEPDKIWPKAIQVQLHGPKAGSTFPLGGATSENTLEAKDISLPVNQWNTGVVTCRAGSISVTINGKKVGEITGCNPGKGFIALQSEGSEIHFRKLSVRKLAAEK